MPPMVHNISSEKPEVMSLTWNPRLVKTPTPTMSATTIDVAVSQDTLATDAPPELRSAMRAFTSTAVPLQGARGIHSTCVSLCHRTNDPPQRSRSGISWKTCVTGMTNFRHPTPRPLPNPTQCKQHEGITHGQQRQTGELQ